MGIPVFFASHNSAAGPGKAPRLAWPNGETRARGVQGANMPGGSRSKTEFIGFAGWRARTESERGAGVGAVRRRDKGLRGARRQHGRPRAGKKAPGLARSDEGTRACGVQGANMNGRPALFKAHCWRNPPVEQGLAGCKAPTCPVTRGRNRNRKRAAAAAMSLS